MPGSWDDTSTPSVLSCCELSLLPLSTPLPPLPIQTLPAVPVRVSRIISSFLSRDVGRLRRVAFEVLGKEVSGRTCDRYLCGLFGRSISEILGLNMFLSLFAVMLLDGVPVCEAGRHESTGRRQSRLQPLPRDRRVPYRQCRLSLGESAFSHSLHPASFISSSVHSRPLPWVISNAS